MCLFINFDKHKQIIKGKITFIAKRATKDIPVYKVLTEDGNPPYQGLRVDRKYEPYQKGFTYKEKSFPLKKRSSECEGRGFHSWMTYESAKYHKDGNVWICKMKIIKMYIPKGAYYYIGKGGDCYSSELKWV